MHFTVQVVGVGRDQYFRSSACSSMPSPSILGRDGGGNDEDGGGNDEEGRGNDEDGGGQGDSWVEMGSQGEEWES